MIAFWLTWLPRFGLGALLYALFVLIQQCSTWNVVGSAR